MLRFLFVLLLALYGLGAEAQSVRLELLVVEAESGTPLPGATAQVVGTARGAAADGDGRTAYLVMERLDGPSCADQTCAGRFRKTWPIV